MRAAPWSRDAKPSKASLPAPDGGAGLPGDNSNADTMESAAAPPRMARVRCFIAWETPVRRARRALQPLDVAAQLELHAAQLAPGALYLLARGVDLGPLLRRDHRGRLRGPLAAGRGGGRGGAAPQVAQARFRALQALLQGALGLAVLGVGVAADLLHQLEGPRRFAARA